MAKPLRKTHPQAPLYEGGAAGVGTITEGAVTQYQEALQITFSQVTDQIDPTQVPLGAVSQYESDLSIEWSQLTSTPTTLAGYGITDAYTKTASDARYAPIAGPFPWADVTGTPTTLSGYGISDAYTQTAADALLAAKAPLASPALTGIPTAPTATAGDSSTKIATTAFVDAAILAGSPGPYPWADVTGTPTTLSGYGITDAYTKTASDALYAPVAGPFPWGDVTGTPTTLGGYGITDFDSLGDARWSPLAGSSSLVTVGVLASPHMTSPVVDSGGLVITLDGLTVTAGNMSVGSTPHTNVGIYVFGPILSGSSTQRGMELSPTCDSSATVELSGLISTPRTPAAAFTAAQVISLFANSIIKGAGSTITNAYGLYVGSQTVGVANYAIYTNTGAVSFGDAVTVRSGDLVVSAGDVSIVSGTIGIGATAVPQHLIQLRGTTSTATDHAALYLNPTFGTAATSGRCFRMQPFTAAGAWTLPEYVGAYIQDISLGAGSSCTIGYGLKIDAIVNAATSYAIYTNAGLVRFGDDVTMASTLTFSTAASRVIPGATSLSFRNNANSADNLIIADAGTASIRGALRLLGSANKYLSGNATDLVLGNDDASGTVALRTTGNNRLTISSIGAVSVAGSFQAGTGFGCNSKTPQTAFASGGAAPVGGTGTAAGGYDTAAHRDTLIALVNNIRSALVANGIMS